jgi:putative SOS response-associated peptidase YedK
LIRFADQRAFAFAGLWERWKPEVGDPIESCTIITTTPNDLIAEYHDRMPVILPPPAFDEWLSASALAEERLAQLLTAYPQDEMEVFPVSTYVNKPVNDDPDCIKPLDQQSLW